MDVWQGAEALDCVANREVRERVSLFEAIELFAILGEEVELKLDMREMAERVG